MGAAQQLLVALRGGADGRRRIPLAEVWQAFRRAIRGYTGDADARPRLAALLAELDAAGAVAQPKTPKRWDRSVEPPLPRWVELIEPREAAARTRDHRTIAWPAAMAFVSDLPQLRNLDELLAIRHFLATGGASRPIVPLRERSVELFGDEKRLDALANGALFRPERLTLELLRCREVAPPLVFEVAPDARSGTVLILENLHSYDSFRRFNQLAGMYRAVAYGHGSEFHATVRDVPRLCAELNATTVEYFGDLDAKGLEIALAADTWLSSRGLKLSPAATWYAKLVTRAEERQLPGKASDVASRFVDWLPAELRDRTRALLCTGYRAPQELVGWETLSALLPRRCQEPRDPA